MDGLSYLSFDTFSYDGTNVTLKWKHADVDAAIPPLAIQVCSNLVGGGWTTIGSFSPVDGTNSWNGGGSLEQFYRLAVTNAP